MTKIAHQNGDSNGTIKGLTKSDTKENDSNGSPIVLNDSNIAPNLGQLNVNWDIKSVVAPEIQSQGAPQNRSGLWTPTDGPTILGEVKTIVNDKFYNVDKLSFKGDTNKFELKVVGGKSCEVDIVDSQEVVRKVSNVILPKKALVVTKDGSGTKRHQCHLSPKLKISRYCKLPVR